MVQCLLANVDLEEEEEEDIKLPMSPTNAGPDDNGREDATEEREESMYVLFLIPIVCLLSVHSGNTNMVSCMYMQLLYCMSW